MPALLSEPTTVFQLASFFDPDAPARPIRIGLPIDTTPSGSRSSTRTPRRDVGRPLRADRGLGKLSLGDLVLSVLPWPFHKP